MNIKCGKGFRVPILNIKCSGRARKNFKVVPQLMESIKKYGLFNPVLVSPIDKEFLTSKSYKLVAGECRLRAMLMLGATEIPCLLREDLSKTEEKEIELEENLRRENLAWPEQIELIAQIDDIKRKEFGERQRGPSINGADARWTQDKTAAIIGLSRSSVTLKLKLARTMRERPDLAEKIKGLPETSAVKVLNRELETEKLAHLASEGKLELFESLRLGDSKELMKSLIDSSIDLLITDPPFGNPVLQDNEGKDRGKSQQYTSQLKPYDNLSAGEVGFMFSHWLAKELFRILKPGSHFYIFFAYECYRALTTSLSDAGLSVSPVPLTWFKGRPTTVFRGYEYMGCSEPILYGHKPPKSKRLSKPEKTLLLCAPVALNDRKHLFEKPQDLLRLLIEQSSVQGDLILDPFAGSGSTLRAAKAKGRSFVGFEIDEGHFLIAQKELQK